ncbi:MAG: S16 family serine protease, partial [Moraxella sp.]|nr:S16 family serine protease [Moraxella sp.]
MPARLTALIAPNFGAGEVLDIERDVELGGSIHAKGMLIMTSYLRALFSEFHELNFSASLAFEQNYGQIDGDSATLAEACALISAISNVPIAQNLAITGSMNQLGEVQAVGGVGEKIAGFFDACLEQGLTGTQGVILPHANISSLMLRDDIVNAVKDGKFHIYAIHHLTDALAILSDMAVDDKNKNGDYKKNTLFGKVVARLSKWGERDDDKDSKEKDTKEKGAKK